MAKKSKYKAPNGDFYEQNDIDYLVNNGYSVQGALDALAQSEKYLKKVSNVTVKVSGKTAAAKLKLPAANVVTSVLDLPAAEFQAVEVEEEIPAAVTTKIIN